jgi:protein-disulfide isomerase
LSLSRRHLLVAGSSVGIATVLFGCEQNAPAAQANAVETPPPAADAPTTDAPAADVALYDGSAVEPLSGDAIMNPDGVPDRPLGGVDADVVLVEYVSPTCPHCATFHATVYPQIKEEYIDTGRITFIARPFVRNVLDAVVFMLAEASDTGYHELLGAFMATQNQWAQAENPRQAIFQIAQQYGFTQERFEEILTDQEMFGRLETMRDQALNEFNLTGTPTFYINGEQLSGNATYDDLSQEIEQRL